MEIVNKLRRAELNHHLEEGGLLCRAICEILGKPKEHVEDTVKLLVEKAKEIKDAELLEYEIMETVPQGTEGQLFSTFAEMQILFKKKHALLGFTFDFMPSSIEILEPEKIVLDNDFFSSWVNELQAKLHKVDMIAKERTMLSQITEKQMNTIIRYNILSHLSSGSLTKEELRGKVGIDSKAFEKFFLLLTKRGEMVTEGDKLRLSPSVKFQDDPKKQ